MRIAKHNFLTNLYHALFTLFIISTLFDPMDKLFGLKIYLFILCMSYGLLFYLTNPHMPKIPIKLIIYIALMIFIPLLSITHYYFIDSSNPFEGFLLFKSYIFITFALLIYITKIDVFRYLSICLVFLSLAIMLISLIVTIFPDLFFPMYLFGNNFGIFSIDPGRDYGAAGKYFQMYFVTSSMIVISIAYFFDKWWKSKHNKKLYLILFLVSVISMFLAGSRNNMLIALFLPLVLFWTYSNKKFFISMLYLVGFLITIIIVRDEILSLFDSSEISNFYKLMTLNDYIYLFSNDIYSLIFGQGLGAYMDWTGRGFNFVTELTYFELVRSYGIFGALTIILLMLYPVIYAFFLKPSYNYKHIIWAYICYLIMSFTNPLFFSSMGMLILSAILASICIHDKQNIENTSYK